MGEKKGRSAIWILVSGLFGLILFLILLVGLRYLAGHLGNEAFSGIVDFLLANAALIVLFGLMFMVADLFSAFRFPADLPAPVFSAIGSLFLVAFVLNLFGYVDRHFGSGLSLPFQSVVPVLYLAVFVIVLFAGYARIFARLPAGEPHGGAEAAGAGAGAGRARNGSSWEDVGAEFRQLLFDLFHRMREEINRK
jgi:hypothetical protein